MTLNKWVVPSVICLLAVAVAVYGLVGIASAGPGPKSIGSGCGSTQSSSSGSSCPVPIIAIPEPAPAADCPLPTPPPTCAKNGETVCSEGRNGFQCQATLYTCACVGTVCTLGTPTQCTQNACTGAPDTVGSKCQ